MSVKTFAVAVAAAFLAVPASAGWWVQSIPGAACQTDSRTTGSWEYRGSRIVNTDTDPWGIVVAVCPVNAFVPGVDPREYRVVLRDPAEGDAWCRLYSSSGPLARQHVTNWSAAYPVWGSFPLAGVAQTGLVEMTMQCLLHAGASLDEIEIVWWKP
ncbi:MAG: hypothetical protein ABW221_09200 [Vicinamibacteria bacterium]